MPLWISLLTAPTAITNGVAQATANGKVITLAFLTKDQARFTAALTYANEQIDLAHGNKKNYKFILHAQTGSRVEVYDDYLILYMIAAGPGGVMGKASDSVGKVSKGLGKVIGGLGSAGTAIGSTAKGGSTGKIIMFTDLTAI